MDPLTISIGVGLLVGLVFVSFLGLSTGGMVVPGYFALEMGHPAVLLVTIMASLLIYIFVKLLSLFLIIYGRRRIAITVLLSFIVGVIMNKILHGYSIQVLLNDDIHVIGYIVPGLIALAIDRQGVIETIGSLLIASVFIRLILIIIIGPQIIGI